MDIQAAFDTISPEAIRQALEEREIPTTITNWYYNYLTHRNITTTVNNATTSGTIGIGFPQGGVCSAKFWIIAFNRAIELSLIHI